MSEPKALQKAINWLRADSDVDSRGVIKQGRSSNRFSEECSIPVFSDPAMGWEPIKMAFSSKALLPLRVISLFTLPTSVTIVVDERLEAICSTRGMIFSTGVQMITSSLPWTASSGVSKTLSHQPTPISLCLDSARRDQIWILLERLRLRTALATEAPRRPGARMVICENTPRLKKQTEDLSRFSDLLTDFWL